MTGFDDDEFSSLVRPALTTVDQDLVGQGVHAARLLLDLIDGASPQEIRHPVRLVARGSTARRPAPVPAESDGSAWEYVWNAMVSMDTMLEVSRTLLTCRSVDELGAVLGREMQRLQVQRAFLVLRQGASAADGGAAADGEEPRGVVRFAVRDGAVQDVSGEAPSRSLTCCPPTWPSTSAAAG